MKIKANCLLIAASISIGACGGGEDPIAGPCLVQYSEPVVVVASASDTVSMQRLDQLTLAGITFNGAPVDLAAAIATSKGVTLSGNALHCTLPCGFGSAEGTYSFVAEAHGHTSTLVTVEARYASRTGTCPTVLNGGTNVGVTLAPS